MRKREAAEIIKGLKAEIAALNAKMAELPAAKPALTITIPKPTPKPVAKKAEPAKKAKPVVIPGAAEAGSPGYDDLVTPINDHDYDWNAEQVKGDG